jgi:hypothetical protein
MTISKLPIKVFVLNAPPYSGKDTLADYMVEKFEFRDFTHAIKLSFASPLKDANKIIFQLTPEDVDLLESSKETKDSPNHELLHGKSWREVNIALSEQFLKPSYGKDIFGNIMAKKIKMRYKNEMYPGWLTTMNVFIADCGFTYEVSPIIDLVGKDNVIAIQIDRPDCNFKSDSRSYINTEELGIKKIIIQNDGNKEQFLINAQSIIEPLMIKENTHLNTL